MVAPRQLCGLFTHTIYSNKTLISHINSNIDNGELFEILLTKQVIIFMTHMTNYAGDRLANFLFKKIFEFLSTWTNLRMKSLEPYELVRKYFEIYKEDSEPVWTNPCYDKKHLSIWYFNNTYCNKFPKVIIIGAQKSGTTALHSFLKLNYYLKSNKPTNDFEETQFFINKNYFKGINWYLNLFQETNGSIINFEKSANYLTDLKVPLRIKNLLNDTKLILILLNPIDRAYSWYQHEKAHNNSIALNYTFKEILTINSTNKNFLSLKEKCLRNGLYYRYLKEWFKYFKTNQFYIIDGNEFKIDPRDDLNKLQQFIGLNESYRVNYTKILKFNSKKGFYCSYKCLGPSKGRKYVKLDDESQLFLKNYYKKSNEFLKKILLKYNFKLPSWI